MCITQENRDKRITKQSKMKTGKNIINAILLMLDKLSCQMSAQGCWDEKKMHDKNGYVIDYECKYRKNKNKWQ